MGTVPMRATPKLTSPPPSVGAGGATVVVVAYKDDGPHKFNADGTLGGALSDGATLATAGQDLVVVLPGRAYVAALEAGALGKGHLPAAGQTAGTGVFVNAQTTPLRRSHGAQIVSVGRHVVVIGGQVDMDSDHTVGGTVGILEQQNRSLYITGPSGAAGPTGNVHIEGIAGTGAFQYEFCNLNTDPSAIVAWQNMAVRAALGADGQTVSVRYKPINAPSPGNHSGGDVLQTFRMPRGIIIDGHLDEDATFQCLFLKAESGNTRPDFLYLRNILSRRYHGPGAWLYLMPDPAGAICPHIRLGGIWLQPSFMFGPNADFSAAVPRTPAVQTSLAGNVYPSGASQTMGFAEDNYPTLTEATWQDTYATTTPGLARTLNPNTAASDDMVLSVTPGMDYRSPGYRLAAAPTVTADLAPAETSTPLAPSDLGVFELSADRTTWIPLNLTMQEVGNDGATMALTYRTDIVNPGAPTAPFSLTLASKAATTVSVRWLEDADPAVAGHRVYVNGTALAAPVAASARSFTVTGLTASTAYTITVRRFNSLGESADSNVLSVTTNAATGGVPAAPTGLARSALTATGVTLSWAEATDATVTSHHVYVNGTSFGSALSASATSTSLTGLTASTAYSVYVTRTNPSGESDASNVITFTTQAAGGGGGTSPYLKGVSSSNNSHPGPWDVVRVYNFGSPVNEALGTLGANIVGLSADGDVPKARTGATLQAGAGAVLRARLTTLFNAHPNAKVYFCNGNELDRKGPSDPDGSGGGSPQGDGHFGNGEGWTQFGQTMAVYRGVVNEFVAAGYFCKLGVDLTQNHVRTDVPTENSIKAAVLPYLDFLAFSMYPPGRTKTPLEYTDYATFIDPCFNQAVAWGTNEVHCWEFGIPIDSNTSAQHTSATNETATTVKVRILGHTSLTTITVPNQNQVRPTYVAYGARYIADTAHSLGMATPQLCYWDSNVGIDNTFQTDPASTSPTTIQSWKNWPTYATLA